MARILQKEDIIKKVGQGYAWWILLFGVFWFLAKGMYGKAFFWYLIGFLTLGLSWLFAATKAFDQYYEYLIEKGYKTT